MLDATWAEEHRRAAARDLGVRTPAELVELRCVVDEESARDRAAARAERRSDVSDADATVVSAVAARFGPWPEAKEISTASTVEESLAAALEAVDTP